MNFAAKNQMQLDSRTAVADLPILQRRIRVAQGQEPGDLLLTGGQIVNVFTQRIEAANVIIADGWIAGVGATPGTLTRRSTWRAKSSHRV